MAWWNRLANLLQRTRVRHEIEEELRYHLQARTADNIAAGMSSEEAQTDAFRRFGGATTALEESYQANTLAWLETVLQDLRYGARSLRSNPGVTLVALISLALAIGANTAIFSIVNTVLWRVLPYANPNRLVMVWVTNTLNGAQEMTTSIPNFEDLRRRTKAFQNLTTYQQAEAFFTVHGESDWIEYASVYGDFFRLLGVNPVLGRVLSADHEGTPEVVLSYRLWRSRFNSSPDVIGRTVNVSGIDVQIVGVMPESFGFPSKTTQLWAPAPAFTQNWQLARRSRETGFGPVVARLRPGITLQQASAEMGVVNRQLVAEYPKENEDHGIRLIPLAAQIHGQTIPFLLAVLAGAALLVLLIACANAANLLLARGAVRRREIALRTALGADQKRLLRQLVTESILLASLSGALGVPLAALSIRALIALAPAGITRLEEARVDARVLFFSLSLSIVTGLLFGLLPALRISDQGNSTRQTDGIDSQRMRRILVVAEVSLAVVLLTGAGLLLRSFVALQSVDPGFQVFHVLTATLRFPNTMPRDKRAALYRAVMTRISQLPGVRAAGASTTVLSTGDPAKFGLRAVEGRRELREAWSPLTWSTISGNYFQALGVPLLRGRFFNDRDTKETTPVVIINQTMARRYWPHEDPIGKGIKGFDPRGHNDEWVRVVGIVRDMHNRGLERAPIAEIYQAQAQSLDETMNLVVRTGASATALREEVQAIDPTAVWTNVTLMRDQLREQSAPRRFQTLLLSLFAVLALALAGIGLFAMIHYSVVQRAQEIGIRMALGARPANVMRMIVGEGLCLVGGGLVIGLAGSWALMHALRHLLFAVGPGDPITLGTVSLLLGAIALLACYVPTRRATRIDPMLALRCD